MMSGDEGLREGEQTAEGAMQDSVGTASTLVNETAEGTRDASAAMANQAEAANEDGARAASAAVGTASEAFGAARDRLNAMSASLPPLGQDMFRPFQSGGEALGKGLESSYATAMEGMAEFNGKAIAAWRSNAESMLRHWQSLASVKSLSEAIALNAEHTRAQLEAVTAQTRDLSALATRIMRGAADPLKTTKR